MWSSRTPTAFETAPAMAAMVRKLVTGTVPEGDFSAVLQYVDDVDPARLVDD